MTARRTYSERRTYSAQVMKWRKAIFDNRELTNSCKILLLRLSDDMAANRIVSVPRSTLAAHLHVAPARISEGIKQARKVGFLDIVQRGRPGITATYAGIFPDSVIDDRGTPERTYEDDEIRVRQRVHIGVRPGVPKNGPEGYAPDPTQEEGSTSRLSDTSRSSVAKDALEEIAPTDSALLSAAFGYATDCPHGIPVGDLRDPWCERNSHICPDCAIDAKRARADRNTA